MKDRVDEEIVRYLWWLRPVLNEDGAARRRAARVRRRAAPPLILNDPSAEPQRVRRSARPRAAAPQHGQRRRGTGARKQPPRVGGDDAAVKTVRRDEPKVGRNDPCPCGSGKKYKKCHGAAAISLT